MDQREYMIERSLEKALEHEALARDYASKGYADVARAAQELAERFFAIALRAEAGRS